MPSAVVLADAPGTVWMVKIPRQIEAQHMAQTYRHQAVSLEVEQQLYGIGGSAHPGKRCGNAFKTHCLDIMPQDSNCIRYDDLERQSNDH